MAIRYQGAKDRTNVNSPYCSFLQINKTQHTMQLLKSSQMGKGYSWAVLLYIISISDSRNISRVSRKQIAQKLGISERAVTNATNNLQRCGAITVVPSKEKGSCTRAFVVNSELMWQSERSAISGGNIAPGTFTRMNFEKRIADVWIFFAKENPTAFAVLLYLACKADYETNCCNESNAEIIQNLKFGSYHTTLNAIQCLKDNGCISLPFDKKSEYSGYVVCPRLFWASARKKMLNSPYSGEPAFFKPIIANEQGIKKIYNLCEITVNINAIKLTNKINSNIINAN